MKLNKEDTKLLYLFEEYVEALIDRRTFRNEYPASDIKFEDRVVDEARNMLLEEIKK